MVKFIFIGDCHLERLVNLLAELCDAQTTILMQLSALRIIYNYARKQDIKYIIYLGDIFHSATPDQTTIALFLQFLREYPEMHNYMIPGNHDWSSVGVHSQRTLSAIGQFIEGSNIYVFDKPTKITIEGVPICFFPWPYTVTPNIKNMAYIKAPDTPHICIGHFDLSGARYSNTIARNKSRVEDLGKDNFWVIGHIHVAQRYYPGTLYQVNFDEPPEKGFVEAHAVFRNGKLQVRSHWHPIKPVFILHNIMYNSEDQLADIVVSKTNLWKLTRHKNSPVVPQQWLINHPNVSVSGIRETTPVILPIHTSINLQNSPEVSPQWGLADYLTERGASPELISRGVGIIDDIIRKVAA
jgi:hypothetical protein